MKKIPIPVYGGSIEFYTDLGKYHKAFHKRTGEHDCAYDGVTYSEDSFNFLLGVFAGGEQTLVHEIIHISLMVFERVGIDPFESDGEPMAYFVDALYGQLVKELRRSDACSASK